jgi:hypothetical protein
MHAFFVSMPKQDTVCLSDHNDEALTASFNRIGSCWMGLILRILWVASEYGIPGIEIGQLSPSILSHSKAVLYT